MRKLLFTLVACVLAFTHASAALYLVGQEFGGGNASTAVELQLVNGYYTYTTGNWSKISTVKGDWDAFNGGCLKASTNPAVKQTQTLNLTKGDSNMPLPYDGTTFTYKINEALTTVEITGANPPASAYAQLYIRGGMNDWMNSPTDTQKQQWELKTEDGVLYVLQNAPAVSSGQSFKVATLNWSEEYTCGQAVQVNTTVTMSGGGDSSIGTSGSGFTFSLNVNTKEFRMSNDGSIVSGGGEKNQFEGWYVNLFGEWNNGDNFTGGYAVGSDGIITADDVKIGNSEFGVKIWDGNSDIYLTYSGEVPTNQWVNLSDAGSSYVMNMKVAGASANSTYKVEFNAGTKQIQLTPTGGSDTPVTPPTYPEKLYLLQEVSSGNWNTGTAPAATGTDGIYTWTDVKVPDTFEGKGYFQFATALSTADNNWDGVNSSTRYGNQEEQQTLSSGVPATIYTFSGNNVGNAQAWLVAAGTYTIEANLADNKVTATLTSTDQPDVPGPDVPEGPFDAMFDFSSYEGMAACTQDLPATTAWTADGATGNVYYYVTSAEVDGVVVAPTAHSGATATNTPRYYKTAAGVYSLRVYNNNTVKISAPEGGYLTTVTITVSSSTTASNFAKTTVDVGELSFDSRTASWSPTDNAKISEITLSPGATIQISTIDVKGEVSETNPTPEAPEAFYIWGEALEGGWSGPGVKLDKQDVALTNNGEYTYVGTVTNLSGQFKIAQSADAWGELNFGGTTEGENNNIIAFGKTSAAWKNSGINFECQSALENVKFTFFYQPDTDKASWLLVESNETTTTYPETVYMMGTVDDYNWAIDKGVSATGNNGVYTFQNVTVNDANQGNGYFNFSTTLGQANESWDETINTKDRYGAPTANAELQKVNVANAVKLYSPEGEEGSNSKDTKSWEAEAGTYDMTLDLTTMELTVTKFTPVPAETETATWTLNYAVAVDNETTSVEGDIVTITATLSKAATFYFTKKVGETTTQYRPASFTEIAIEANLGQPYELFESTEGGNMFVFGAGLVPDGGQTEMRFIIDTTVPSLTVEKVSTPEPEVLKAYLGVAQNAAPTAPSEAYELTLGEDGNYTLEGVELQKGAYFNLWFQNAAQTLALDAAQFTSYGPAQDGAVLTYTEQVSSFTESFVASNYAWQIGNEQNVTLNFNVNKNAGTMTVVNTAEINDEPEVPAGKIGMLQADDYTITIDLGTPGVVAGMTRTAEIPVRLIATEEVAYNGLQFDVQMPDDFTLTGATVNDVLGGSLDYRELTQTPGTYRVLVNGCDGLSTNSAIEYLVKLEVSKTYETLPTAGIYNNTMTIIEGHVIFSDLEDEDILNIAGSDSNIEEVVNNEIVPATAINITAADLMLPSWNKRAGYLDDKNFVQYVTKGQSIELTFNIQPENASYQTIEWTSSNTSIVIENTNGAGKVIIPTAAMTVEGEPQTVTITATIENGDYEPVTKEYSFDVKKIIEGDANDNGYVTVSDVVDIADYILSIKETDAVASPAKVFDYPNADIAGEAGIDDADLTATINIVLGGAPVPSSMRRKARTLTNDMLVVDDFKVNGVEPFAIGVDLKNTYKYSSLQALVTIPEGMELVEITKGARAAAHELRYNTRFDGKVIVLLYSNENAAIADGEGELFNLVVRANEECGNVKISQIKGADANANSYGLGFAGGENQSETTGVDGIDAAEQGVRYFTVDGVEIVNPQPGQIVIKMVGGKAVKEIVK